VAVLPDGYEIRTLEREDASALAAAYRRNREHLAPWDPVRPERFFSDAGQRGEVEARLGVIAQGSGASWVLVHEGAIVGRVNLNNVVRGVFQSASLGYWTDGAHTGRGLGTSMVEHAVEQAVGLGLHRLEAGTLVHNLASQGVLRRAGFSGFGKAEKYLFIAGAWQDHLLFQRILGDRPAGKPALDEEPDET
jgi:[ribosomal protein S5]-alanine N-acetyltransferase